MGHLSPLGPKCSQTSSKSTEGHQRTGLLWTQDRGSSSFLGGQQTRPRLPAGSAHLFPRGASHSGLLLPPRNSGCSDLGAFVMSEASPIPQGRHPLHDFLLRNTPHLWSPASISCLSVSLVEERDAPGPARRQNVGLPPFSSLQAHSLTPNRKFKKKA